MKILYAIQGTGNGHIARAEDIIPILKQYGDIHIFISGAQADIKLKYPVKYKSKGLSFYFGKKGGIDFLKTFKKNSSKDVYKEIKKFPIEKYDLVLNDFEPVSAWASFKREIPIVGLSHQAALLSPLTPQPKNFDPVGEWLIKNYAPTKKHIGFHFQKFDDFIYTPVIRKSIRDLVDQPTKEHYTVYLPAYDDKKLVALFMEMPNIRWHIFSKHINKPYHIGKISVYPVNNEEFTLSMATARGVLCGAGFETPAEALYLKKKLMVVPMQSQLEQHYNAAALKQMGVDVLKKVKRKNLVKINEWVESSKIVNVNYEDSTTIAVEHALRLGGMKF